MLQNFMPMLRACNRCGSICSAVVQARVQQKAGRGRLERISRRRSERRYARAPMAAAELSALLDAALRRTGPLLSAAVRVHVL
ncbi:MAG: hypothetical protein ACOVKV_14875, partial [Novosphingobium sp.]